MTKPVSVDVWAKSSLIITLDLEAIENQDRRGNFQEVIHMSVYIIPSLGFTMQSERGWGKGVGINQPKDVLTVHWDRDLGEGLLC